MTNSAKRRLLIPPCLPGRGALSEEKNAIVMPEKTNDSALLDVETGSRKPPGTGTCEICRLEKPKIVFNRIYYCKMCFEGRLNKKCRSVGCEFYGTQEAGGYCSNCIQKVKCMMEGCHRLVDLKYGKGLLCTECHRLLSQGN